MVGEQVFNDLREASWDVAARTFGNDHATLIGLLIAWWVLGDLSERWALEGGMAFGHFKRGQPGNGQCDALLCQGKSAVGILEVEGGRPKWAVEKIGKYFAAEEDDFRPLEFAILLLYGRGPTGRGSNRHYQPALVEETETCVRNVSKDNPDKALIVITLDKLYERQSVGIRSRSEYYWGKPKEAHAKLWNTGSVVRESSLLQVEGGYDCEPMLKQGPNTACGGQCP